MFDQMVRKTKFTSLWRLSRFLRFSSRFLDEKFREECQNLYLDERSEYRRTGLIRKQIKRPYYINPEKEKERIDKIRKEYERLENKSQDK